MRMRTQRILAALLSLVLLLALAPAGWAEETPAAAEETPTPCYVQVVAGGDSVIDDLKNANIVVDVYKVAIMTKSKQYDTYEFTATTAFAGSDDGTIEQLVKDIQERLEDSEIDKKKWELLAEGALEAVQKDTGGVIQHTTYEADANGVANLTGITQGLYLVVAHTKDLPDYLRTIKSGQKSSYLDANGNPVFVTEEYDRTISIAQTEQYEYSYAAQLIAIPTKEPDENGVIKTSNKGPWLFGTETDPLKYVLKPGRVSRNGDLKIVKTLQTTGDDKVSFVFQITWTGKDDTTEVRYAEITVNGSESSGEYTLEKVIPVGTEVTVKEVHTGLEYTLVSANDQTAVIATADEVANDSTKLATVSFTNDHSGPGSGHGIVNRFTSDGGENFTWIGKPLPDSNQPAEAENS